MTRTNNTQMTPPRKTNNEGMEFERRSPRGHKSSTRASEGNEQKRGKGPQGRGGKIPRRPEPEDLSSESSESESEEDDEGNDGRYGIKRTKDASKEELLSMLRKKERIIMKLQAEVHSLRNKGRPNKTSLRVSLNWTGEEVNFADSVFTFVREFLFPRYKFLRHGWQNYEPDRNYSLSSMCLRRLSIPEGSDAADIWERVIVPAIQMKYTNIKGNMNNDLKKIYMSDSELLSVDEYAEGLKPLMKNNKMVDEEGFIRMYEFFTKYIRRIHPDTHWKRAMKMHPNKIWFQLITPSDIAFVISLLKNGLPKWKKKAAKFDSDDLRKTTAEPLFTSGKGQKRKFGKTTWSKEGIQYYIKAEKAWHESYNDGDQMSALVNGWEKWEPREDLKKIKELLNTNWQVVNDDKKSGEHDEDEDGLDDGYHSDKYSDVEEFPFELDDENLKRVTGLKTLPSKKLKNTNEESEDEDVEDDDHDKGEGDKGGNIANKEKEKKDERRKSGRRK